MRRVSIKRMWANILCVIHCLTHFHREAVHGKGRIFCGVLVWDEVDIIWCEDCGKVYYDESNKKNSNETAK